jgi:AcrR family transcriptional regulator
MVVNENTAAEGTELPIAGATKERADAAANRVRILEAARRLLVERGAAGTSMDAVAALAGVGKGTVFRRFGDRSGLFQALLDAHMRELQDSFLSGPPPLGPGAPASERLVAFFDAFLEFQDSHLELSLALEKDRWGASIIGGYVAISMHLETLIAELSPALDAPTTAQLLLGASNINVVAGLRREGGVSPDALKAAMRALVAGLEPVRAE